MARLACCPVIKSIISWRQSPSKTAGYDYDIWYRWQWYNVTRGHLKFPLHVRLCTSGITNSTGVYPDLDKAYAAATMSWSPVYDYDEDKFYNTVGKWVEVNQMMLNDNPAYVGSQEPTAVCMMVWDADWNMIDHLVHHEVDDLDVHVDTDKTRLYDSQAGSPNSLEHSITIRNLDVIEPEPHAMPLNGGYWWVNPTSGSYTNNNFGRGFTAVYWIPKLRSDVTINNPLLDTWMLDDDTIPWQDKCLEVGTFHIYEYVLYNQWMIPDTDPWDENKAFLSMNQPGDMLLGIAGNNNTYTLLDTSYLNPNRPTVFNGIMEVPRIKNKNCYVFPISSNAINLQGNDGSRQWYMIHTAIPVAIRHRMSPERGMWIMPEPPGLNATGMGDYPCFLAESWTRTAPNFGSGSTIPCNGTWTGDYAGKWGTRYLQKARRMSNVHFDPIQLIQAHYAVNPNIFASNAGSRPTDFTPITNTYNNCTPRKFTTEVTNRLLNGMWFRGNSNWRTQDGSVDYTGTAAAHWTSKFFTGYHEMEP